MVRNISSIVSRVMNPEAADMPPEMARRILAWQFADADRRRAAELLEKNNANEITRDELSELQTLLVLSDLLDILHAQADLSLQTLPPAAQAS